MNGSYDTNGIINETSYQNEITRLGGSATIKETGAITKVDGYTFLVNLNTGEIEQIAEQPENTPEYWQATTKEDSEWYNYIDLTSNATVEVNSPKLKGNMTLIKYVGETQEGSKWANAMTTITF